MAESYNAKPIQLDDSNNAMLLRLGDQMRQEKAYQRQLDRENRKNMLSAYTSVDDAVRKQGWEDEVTARGLKEVTDWAAKFKGTDAEDFHLQLDQKLAQISTLNSSVKRIKAAAKSITEDMAKTNPGLNAANLESKYLQSALFKTDAKGGLVLKEANEINSDPTVDILKMHDEHPDAFYNTEGFYEDISKYQKDAAFQKTDKTKVKERFKDGSQKYSDGSLTYNARTQKILDGEIVPNVNEKTGLIDDQVFHDLNRGRLKAHLVSKANDFLKHYNDPKVTDESRSALLGVKPGTLPKFLDPSNPETTDYLMKAFMTKELTGLGSKSEADKGLLAAPNYHTSIKIDNKPPVETIDGYGELSGNFKQGPFVNVNNKPVGAPVSKYSSAVQDALVDMAKNFHKTVDNEEKKLDASDLIIKEKDGKLYLHKWDKEAKAATDMIAPIDPRGFNIKINGTMGVPAKQKAAQQTKKPASDYKL